MKTGTLVTGIILMIIGAIGYFSMQQSLSDCGSFVGQLGRFFSQDISQQCQMAQLIQIGSAIFGVIGLGLTIAGAVAKGGESKRPKEFYCKHCGFVSETLDAIRAHVQYQHENSSITSENQDDKATFNQKIDNDDLKNLGILKERLAKGEITKEEYDELKKEFE